MLNVQNVDLDWPWTKHEFRNLLEYYRDGIDLKPSFLFDFVLLV